MNPTPLLKTSLKKIEWRKLMHFLFVLSLLSVIGSAITNDVDFILHSLVYFIIMLSFLMIDVFIAEYKERKKFNDLNRTVKIILVLLLFTCCSAPKHMHGEPRPPKAKTVVIPRSDLKYYAGSLLLGYVLCGYFFNPNEQ